jgi:maleamate amidohydrolase
MGTSAASDEATTERRHAWEDVIDDEVRALTANYRGRIGLLSRPALLCIDNYQAVFGDRREPLLSAIQRFPQSCGEAAWDAVEPTVTLLAAAREAGVPIIHTTRDDRAPVAGSTMTATKRRKSGSAPEWDRAFLPALAPQEGETIIYKPRASAFFGTALAAHLVRSGIDSLIVCGNSTSGCVRASVNEAYMQGWRVAVVEECVFDRNHLSHKVNLYDMNTKYADVMFLHEVLSYLQNLKES